MKKNKFITLITLVSFTTVAIFSPFPGPTPKTYAQNTSSLRLVANTAGFSFKKDLALGDTDPDVKELQKILNSSLDTAVAVSGVGSLGQESTYFGNLTKTAVIKFQEKYKSEILTPVGLPAGNGIVGQTTRAKLNVLLGITTPTLASTGSPQSRAGSGTATMNIPASVPSQTSVCAFVELLIGIGAVSPSKANAARSALNCLAPVTMVTTPAPSQSAVCTFVNLLINIGVIAPNLSDKALAAMSCTANAAYVDVKVNGSQGPISVLPGTEIRLSWHSEGTKSCSDGLITLPTSGAVRLVANNSLNYPVSCLANNGSSVVDSATVIVSTSTNATSTIQVLSSKITPGYDFATFEATTNVPTKMVIAYTNNPTATSSVKIYESATSTVHSNKITGLVPNSTYYARVAFVVSNIDNIMTEELTFTTLADASSAELAQRVLSSATGKGVVSIPESASLKTDTQVTLEAWVKPTSWSISPGLSNTNDSIIISKGNIGGSISYVLSLDNGKLVYSNNDSSIWTNAPVVPLNVWTHVAVSVSESAMSINLYVNGVKQTSVGEGPRGAFSAAAKINRANAITETPSSIINNNSAGAGGWGDTTATTTSGTSGWDSAPTEGQVQSLLPQDVVPTVVTSNVYFGNLYPNICLATSTTAVNEGNGFIGLIDDVKIWNISRTADQIKADSATTTASSSATLLLISTSTNVIPELGLVGHWSFDDGSPSDLTYNSNNGSLKGDMEIVDDQSAVSPILGAGFGLSGLEFNFPETCDSSLYPENTAGAENLLLEQAGYEISFTGGVKSVSKSGSYYVVVLETCDNPAEELVKSVKLVGKAPPRDKSYYNILGNVSVAIAPNMKVPAERDTIQGTALDLIANPTSAVGVKSSPGANSIGYATNWQPQPKSCMQPPKKGGPLGNFGIIGAIVGAIALVIITIYCAPCAFALSQLYIGGFAATTAVGVVTATTVVAGAGAGYMAGSQIEKE